MMEDGEEKNAVRVAGEFSNCRRVVDERKVFVGIQLHYPPFDTLLTSIPMWSKITPVCKWCCKDYETQWASGSSKRGECLSDLLQHGSVHFFRGTKWIRAKLSRSSSHLFALPWWYSRSCQSNGQGRVRPPRPSALFVWSFVRLWQSWEFTPWLPAIICGKIVIGPGYGQRACGLFFLP